MKTRPIIIVAVLAAAALAFFFFRGGNSSRWKKYPDGGCFLSTTPIPKGSQLRIETRAVGGMDQVLLTITSGKMIIGSDHKYTATTLGAVESYTIPREAVIAITVVNYNRKPDVIKKPVSASDSGDTTTLRFAEGGELAVTIRKNWRTGDLTRELAADILNEHLAKPSVSQLTFNNGGIDRAKQDGVIEEQGGFPPSFRFTDKGLKMVGTIIGQNYIELAPFGMKAPKFALKSGMGQRVSEVSGIAEGPTPNIKSVEYVTDYIFPSEMQPITRYIFSGSKEQSAFQKYDDGWRVAQ